MATLTGKLVADTYKALLKMIDNDVVTATEKQISDGLGGGTGIFIDQDGEIRASKYRVTAGTSSQFLKADGSLDSTSYLPSGTTTTSIPEGSNLYFTNSRVLNTTLNGFTAISGTVTSADSVLTAIEKIWWNIVNGGGGGGGGYVPYVGATQNLNLGEYGLLGGFVQFDTTPTTAPNAVGALSWNDQDGTLDLKLKGGNVTLQIGQEQVTRVVNKTGINLLESNYQAVRISGAQGNRLKVALAQANNDANSAETLGLVTENINDNNEGFITSSGLVRDINTTGSLQGETWADGDILYLSGTTAGIVTNIKPQAPIHTVIIGFVVRAHATQGAIYVKVDNGYELDELHNVKITAPEDKDFLVYDGTNLYWENRSIYGTEGYLPIYNDTNIFNDSIIYSDGVGIGVGTNILEPTAIATFFGNIDLVTGTYLTSDGFNLIGRGNLINQIEIGSQNASDYLTFIAGNSERARITAAGNFGIGLTNPSAPLHVKGSTYTNLIVDNNSATGGGSYLSYQNGTKKALFGLSGAFELNTGSDVAIASTIAGGGIKFYTNNSTTQAMGIVSSGNAYLGQAPTFLGLGTEFIVRGQASDGVLGVMDNTEAVKGLFVSNSSLSWLGTYSNHPLAFKTNNTEWARISNAGNLLIGTIVDNATDKLQVNGTSYFGDNIVLADSKGIVSSGVNMLSRNNLNNQIIIGADGGINDNVAFYSGDLERMRLLANGRLAINKTTASYQVDVQGDVNVSGAFRVNGTIIPNGTVTSVAMSVPTGLVISGSPITSSGTLAVTYAVNYGIPTLTKQSDWDDAYTWVTNFPDQLGNAGKFLTTNGSALSWASLVTGVSSVFGRTGAVTAQSGDYTTAQVTESGNLYYTDARARLALSASAPLSYNNGTGAFSISQASGSTNGFLSSTDWNTFNNKQNALGYTPVPTTRTLTINGTSYDLSADRSWTISAGLSGSGTTNYVSKFTGSTSIGNSLIFDNGTNVGIGTTSPSYKLSVVGNLFVTPTSGYNVLFQQSGTTFRLNYLNDALSANVSASFRAIDYSWQKGDGSEVLKLDSSGNLGLGVTPSAWGGNTSNVLEFSNGVALLGNKAVPASYLVTNAYSSNGGASFIYKNTDFATSYIQYNGQHLWSTAPSGTAGNAISFTQAMTLNASGNLGIGSTNPDEILTLNRASSLYARIVNTSNSVSTYWGVNGTEIYFGSSSNSPVTFYSNSTERMRITSNGLVSIGETSPAYLSQLTISYNPASNNGPIILDRRSFNANVGGIQWLGGKFNSAGDYRPFGGVGAFKENGTDGNSAGYLSLFTNSNAADSSEKMRINAGGNVSIGNTNNTYKLDVNNVGAGVANTRIYGNDQANVRLRLENAGAGGRTYEIVGGLAGANNSSFSIFDATASSTRLQIDSTGAATFSSSVTAGGYITSKGQLPAIIGSSVSIDYISSNIGRIATASNATNTYPAFTISQYSSDGSLGRDALYITSTGNVGIGTTSPTQALTIQKSGYPIIDFYDGATGRGDIGFNTATSSFNIGAYGAIPMVFYVNSSERMRITSGGDVNIGSSPSTGYKFNVRNASGNYLSFWSPTIGGVATNGFLSHNGGGFNSQVSMGYNATVHVFNGEVTGGGLVQVAGDVNISGAFKINGTAIGTGGGGVSGSGTTNYLAKWTSGTSLSNSNILDTGSTIYMYTNTSASNVQFYYESSTWGTGTNHFRSSVFPLALDGSTIYFSNGGTQRMYLNSSGSRLFTGNGNLDTIGSTASGGVSIVRFDSTTGIGYDAETIHVFYTAGTEIARFNTGGELLLGTTTDNGAYKLQVNSQIWATNATIATSDVRLKDNIQDISNALSVIMGLKPRTFTYKQDKGYNFGKFTNTGFIAQEIKESMIGLNYLDSIVLECGNYYGVAYEKFIPILTKGIQEQQVMIETNAEKIARLEKRVLQLESKNA